ncbi:hypothetical protein GOV14_00515 [Candidatus Pacearchaeota archaeon]|nr:hypothetical protein [Candidatus Pacearchaeota archaeon]
MTTDRTRQNAEIGVDMHNDGSPLGNERIGKGYANMAVCTNKCKTPFYFKCQDRGIKNKHDEMVGGFRTCLTFQKRNDRDILEQEYDPRLDDYSRLDDESELNRDLRIDDDSGLVRELDSIED